MDPRTVQKAKLEAKKAFEKWQRLRCRATLRREEMEAVESQMYLRLRKLAIDKATGDIRRIQAVMGITPMKEGQGGQEFRAKLSGRLASQAEEIARSLQEPLECPKSKSDEESPPTQS